MSAHPIAWSHGRAEILTTAGMLAGCTFMLGEREFSPFANAPWAPDEFPHLPAHLRVLGAEFVCVPFGEAGPVTRTTEGWHSIGSALPNAPGHGYSAYAEWEIVDVRPGGVTLQLHYPAGHDIESLERRIDGIPGIPGLAFSLTITARRDTKTSAGLHPILRLPSTPRSLEIDAAFRFGLTFPGDLTAGKALAARGAEFSDLAAVPLEPAAGNESGAPIGDFSRLPFDAPVEGVVQLCGVSQPLVFRFLDENASLTIDWDRQLLPSAMIWIEDRALTEPPWNGTYRGLGIEPIASAFDFANDVSVHDNPISERGVATSIAVSPTHPLTLEYQIIASISE